MFFAGVVLPYPLLGYRRSVEQGTEGEAGTGKILLVICSNMQF